MEKLIKFFMYVLLVLLSFFIGFVLITSYNLNGYTNHDNDFIDILAKSNDTNDLHYAAFLSNSTSQKMKLLTTVNSQINSLPAAYLFASLCIKEYKSAIGIEGVNIPLSKEYSENCSDLNGMTEALLNESPNNAAVVELRATYLMKNKEIDAALTVMKTLTEESNYEDYFFENYAVAEAAISKYEDTIEKTITPIYDHKVEKSIRAAAYQRLLSFDLRNYCHRGYEASNISPEWDAVCHKFGKIVTEYSSTTLDLTSGVQLQAGHFKYRSAKKDLDNLIAEYPDLIGTGGVLFKSFTRKSFGDYLLSKTSWWQRKHISKWKEVGEYRALKD